MLTVIFSMIYIKIIIFLSFIFHSTGTASQSGHSRKSSLTSQISTNSGREDDNDDDNDDDDDDNDDDVMLLMASNEKAGRIVETFCDAFYSHKFSRIGTNAAFLVIFYIFL